MPTDSPTPPNSWPLPTFRFEVDFNDQLKNISFQEVSGLETEQQVLEYRTPNSPEYTTIKMPGITKLSNVTLKRGMFPAGTTFWTWLSQIQMNTIVHSTITIRLLDENGHTTMTWALSNAWPTKITSTDLKSDGNEVAVDSIEVACEGIVVGNQ